MRKKSEKAGKRRGGRPEEACKKAHEITALLLVDQEPFLKKALSRCRRLRNELNKKQALLRDYEDCDATAFQQWLNCTFGAKLSKIRELGETLSQHEFILFNLSNCFMFCPDKLPEVHKELFKRKDDGSLYQFVSPMLKNFFGDEETEDRDDTDEWEDDEGWEDDESWEEEEEDWDEETEEDIFNELFGEEPSHCFQSMDSSEQLRLKKCYRSLAKKLHPDHSNFDESLREKRWHEAQEAYQNNDLEALLRLEAFCDLDETDLSVSLGLARLNDLANYHQSHLKPIRRALKEAKQDIAFGFAESGPTGEIEMKIDYELKGERADLQFQIKGIQQSIDNLMMEWEERQKVFEVSFAKPVTIKKPKPKKKRQVHDHPEQMELF